MEYAIVTGSSKGLGESLAVLFLESGIPVIGIARSENDKLKKTASENHMAYHHIKADLSDIEALPQVCEEISEIVFEESPSTIYLINNAGVVEPISQASEIDAMELQKHIQVNTIAPMVINNFFLKKASEKDVELRSCVITSGAAESPMYGWSAYCSTKASMNMYTDTVALEQQKIGTDHKVIAFSPGIMDTGMQDQIRASSKEDFTEVDKFKDYKKSNLLKDTDLIGGVLIDILTGDDIQNGAVYYAKNYL